MIILFSAAVVFGLIASYRKREGWNLLLIAFLSVLAFNAYQDHSVWVALGYVGTVFATIKTIRIMYELKLANDEEFSN